MRIAAIDIGTNSLHMIVVQVRPDLSFEVIDREKDMVRLGAGGLDGRSLTPTAMDAALQTLSKFRRLAESHKVDEIVAAATSATREADNGGEFIGEVNRLTGIRIRVISGTEEARLIHLAAGYGVDIGGSTGVVIDIGGGSVEITLGTATQMTLGKSFKVGVIRLTERFVKAIRCRTATSAGWSSTSIARWAPISIRSPSGVRPRHRHVGHDPQPRRPRLVRRSQRADRGTAQPAGQRQGAAPAPQAARRA